MERKKEGNGSPKKADFAELHEDKKRNSKRMKIGEVNWHCGKESGRKIKRASAAV